MWAILLVITVFTLGAIILVRNEMVYSIRMKRLGQLSDKAGKYPSEKWWEEFGKFKNGPSYHQMVFDLTRWKFDHFYNDLP